MKEYLENVRCVAPLIHNITNYVTANDVANVLLACGASGIIQRKAILLHGVKSKSWNAKSKENPCNAKSGENGK